MINSEFQEALRKREFESLQLHIDRSLEGWVSGLNQHIAKVPNFNVSVVRIHYLPLNFRDVVQWVRTLVLGTRGRLFEPGHLDEDFSLMHSYGGIGRRVRLRI